MGWSELGGLIRGGGQPGLNWPGVWIGRVSIGRGLNWVF